MKRCTSILSKLRSEQIALGREPLPDVYDAVFDDVVQTVGDVPGFGKLLFTHRRHKYSHHKSTSWFWCTVSAIRVDDL